MEIRWGSRPRAVASLVAPLLPLSLVVACSDEAPKAEPRSSPTGTPSPITTASPAATSSPEKAIEAWLSALVDMQNSGDTSAFLDLSTQDCSYCRDFAKQVRDVYAAGGSAAVDPTEVKQVTAVGGDSQTEFLAQIVAGAGRLTEGNGKAPIEFEGGPQSYAIGVRKEAATWRVHSVALLQSR